MPPHGNNRTWTDEDLTSAVALASSIAGVCRLIGIVPIGGNYRTVKHHITRLGLDTGHHTGQAWNRDNYRDPSPESTKNHWKVTLIRKRGHRCEGCGLTEWRGLPITLELEHRDGNTSNNVEDNLELLCCNCHSQTPTWRRKKNAA